MLPNGKTEWQPSITLFEIIQEIPNFIRSIIQQKDKANQLKIKYHLGVDYDLLTWNNCRDCNIYPCQEQKDVKVKTKDSSGEIKQQTIKKPFNSYLVVTPTTLLLLRTNDRLKNVARLVVCASIFAIEKVKNGLDNTSQVAV